MSVEVVLLVPKDDQLKDFQDCLVLQGDENDVLSRYGEAIVDWPADYICRITADCPEIPAPLISKAVFTAMNHELDYASNVGKGCKTFADGFDVQVMSKELLEWLDENADTAHDREHVLTFLDDTKPEWVRVGHILSYCDNSHLKLSVDTQEDLDFVRAYTDLMQSKITRAKNTGEVLVRF